MAKPGPKSAADMLGPIIPAARPAAPADLLPEERDQWDSVVGCLPADWFSGANWPLLKQFCRHTHNADLLAQDAVRQRAELAQLAQDDVPEEQRLRLARELRLTLRAHGFETACMVSLATKLRLTKLSRYARADAAAAGARAGAVPRPWEDWGGKQ
jgi:hypothetical protein